MSAAEDHQLLDLNFLDEEEKLQIEAVLKRSYEEIKKEENRLNKLQEEIDARNEQVRLYVAANGGRSCPMCEQPFGIIFSTGARCPECFRKVCKQCRVPPQATRNFICTLCEKKSILRLGRSRTLKYETATPAEDEDIFGTNLVMKSLKNLQKFNEEFPLSGLTRVMTLPTKRGENKGAGPRRMSGLLRQSKRHSKPDLHDREGTAPTTEKEPPSVTSEGEVPTDRHKEVGEVPTAMCEEPPDLLLPAFERRDSLASAFSTYSGAEAKGDYSITGEVLFGLEYHSGQLLVHVVGARGLAAADKGGSSDPYVKTYLLPDKKKESKKKTKVVKKTLNPTFNETLKYEVSESSLLGRTLWLSVWDWDRFGRNQFLGEVRVALKEFDLSTYTERWYLLKDKSLDLEEGACGELLLAIKAEPVEKTPFWSLDVRVKEARQLVTRSAAGQCGAFVKCCLLPNVKDAQKTSVVHRASSSPIWNDWLTFSQLRAEELESKMVLEVTVWDKNSAQKANDFLGGVRLGPDPSVAMATNQPLSWMDSVPEEVDYWSTVLSSAGLCVERWLPLRPTMQSRNVPTAPAKRPSSPVPPESKDTEIAKEDSSSLPQSPALPTTPVTTTKDSSSLPQSPALPTTPVTTTKDSSSLPQSPALPTTPVTTTKDSSSLPQSPALPTTPVITVQDSPRQKKHSSKHLETTLPQQEEAELTPSVSTLPRSESISSFSSAFSTYSGAEAKGDYSITGEVLFGLEYHSGQLLVRVVGARDLAAANKGGSSDPYVKTYLLPDKKKESKKKTKVVKKTLNPTFNETLKYEVSESSLLGRTLWLSVWDWDRFGRNQFLGEVRVALKEFDLSTYTERWYPLKDKDDGHFDDRPHGDVLLGLMYDPRGVVHIHVKQGRGLQMAGREQTDTVNAFAKIYLLPDRSTKGKRKTPVIKNNHNPVWFHKCSYEGLSQTELAADRVLEVTLWHFQRGSSNEFIGGLRLGSHRRASPGGVSKEYDDISAEESAHWKQMLSQPEEWVERWHSLQSTMDPIEVESTPAPAHQKMKHAPRASPLVGHSRKTSSVSADMVSGQGRYAEHSRKTSSGSADMVSGQGRYAEHSRKTSSGSADIASGFAPSSPPYGASALSDQKSTLGPRYSPLRGHRRKPSPGTKESTPPSEGTEKLSVQASVPAPANEQEDVPEITNIGVAHSPPPPSLLQQLPEESLPSTKVHGPPHEEAKGSILSSEVVASPPKPAIPAAQGRWDSKERGQADIGDNLEEEREGAKDFFSEEVLVFEEEALEDEKKLITEVSDPLSPAEVPSGLKEASPVPGLVVKETDPYPSMEDAPVHPSTPASRGLPRTESVSSLGSVYSTLPEKGDYSITGEVLFGLEYHSGQLLVHVVGARGLAAADKGGSSDPYVKTYLLPDKKKESKKKTKVVKKTLNPTFNETLKYEVSESSLLGRTLWLSVWDWDRFGRNQFLGEVRVALKEFDLSTYTERWYLLNDKVSGAGATIMDAPAMPTPQAKFPMIGQDLLHAGSVSSLGSVYSTLPEKGDYSITGEVLFGLEYHSGQLLVHVVGARGLAAADKGGSSDPYVKTYLLPDKKKESKKKTKVIKKTVNPTFNETLKYKVPNSGLEKRTLCLSVWDDNFGRNKFLGQVKVPLSEVDLSQRRDRWMTLMEK